MKKTLTIPEIFLPAIAALFLASCFDSPTSPDTDGAGNTECGPTYAVFCADTLTDGNGAEYVAVWDPDNRYFFELTYENDTLSSSASYWHVYNSMLRDSIVYWLSTFSNQDTAWHGYAVYEYDGNDSLKTITLFDATGRPYEVQKYNGAGSLVAKGDPGCGILSPDSCSDTVYVVDQWGDTVTIHRTWDPQTRALTETGYSFGYINNEYSFIHVYDAQYRDSIVYWVDYVDQDGNITVSGWGEYDYDNQGNLIRIENYNEFDENMYGWTEYDTAGNLKAQMEDGWVTEYNDSLQPLKQYFEGTNDTTHYFYNDTGKLIEERSMRDNVISYQTLFGQYDSGFVQIYKKYDSTGTIQNSNYYDANYRLGRKETYAGGALASIEIYTYKDSSSYTKERTDIYDGNWNLQLTYYHDDTGYIVQQQVVGDTVVDCLKPISRDSCATL
ncbi:MAG: hypothetical protein GF398_09980 [Chitinivibrionales bacterium]|nr:hypothetical protein [Chitinivibrionales bacterium]